MQWIPGLLSPPPLEGLGTRLGARGVCALRALVIFVIDSEVKN